MKNQKAFASAASAAASTDAAATVAAGVASAAASAAAVVGVFHVFFFQGVTHRQYISVSTVSLVLIVFNSPFWLSFLRFFLFYFFSYRSPSEYCIGSHGCYFDHYSSITLETRNRWVSTLL